MIEALALVAVGVAVGAATPIAWSWLRYRHWHMMPSRGKVRRIRDRIRWVRALRGIDRALRHVARDHYTTRSR